MLSELLQKDTQRCPFSHTAGRTGRYQLPGCGIYWYMHMAVLDTGMV